MRTLRLIAVDIDGVLLEDTFSPVIRNFITKHGIEYTKEIEKRCIFPPSKKSCGIYDQNPEYGN